MRRVFESHSEWPRPFGQPFSFLLLTLSLCLSDCFRAIFSSSTSKYHGTQWTIRHIIRPNTMVLHLHIIRYFHTQQIYILQQCRKLSYSFTKQWIFVPRYVFHLSIAFCIVIAFCIELHWMVCCTVYALYAIGNQHKPTEQNAENGFGAATKKKESKETQRLVGGFFSLKFYIAHSFQS